MDAPLTKADIITQSSYMYKNYTHLGTQEPDHQRLRIDMLETYPSNPEVAPNPKKGKHKRKESKTLTKTKGEKEQ